MIADSNKLKLPQVFADSMAHMLMMQDVAISGREWLAEGVALDMFAGTASPEALDAKVQDAMRGYAFDAIVQPLENRRKKLLVADMESTMIVNECLDELAEYKGIKDRVAAITARAMNGEIGFEQALSERVGLLKGLPESALSEVMEKKVKLTGGARALVATMKASGAYTLLVSGGFDFFAERIGKKLGFDEVRCNRLEIEGSTLTGRVMPPILGKDAKLKALEEACARLCIKKEETLAAGDGANDVPMLLAAGLGVAFRAKPAVRAQAKARIDHADLTALLYAQGYRKEDFAVK